MNGAIPGCLGCATPLLQLQILASHWLHSHPHVVAFMNSIYGWPLCETVHYVGLSLLVGTVGVFDLRVLGMARRIPIDALQRLTRWGILGWGMNLVTGLMFLMAFPNQYLYQSLFIWKIAFMLLAGLNATIFNLFAIGPIARLRPGEDAPFAAKVMCAASLCLWIGVIFAGRLMAFYKPIFTMPPP